MARGLQKLILDGCTFSDPTDVREWRWQALEASAAALLTGAQETADAHLECLADELDVEPLHLEERLYADLPEKRVSSQRQIGLQSTSSNATTGHWCRVSCSPLNNLR